MRKTLIFKKYATRLPKRKNGTKRKQSQQMKLEQKAENTDHEDIIKKMERAHRTKEDSLGRNLPAIAIYRLEFFRRSKNLVHKVVKELREEYQ